SVTSSHGQVRGRRTGAADMGRRGPDFTCRRKVTLQMSDYHPFVPPMGKARYFGLTHAQVLESLPRDRLDGWKARLESLHVAPFRGITTNGQVVPGLFALRDEGAPTANILAAIMTLLGRLTPEQSKAVRHPIDSIARRQWVNEVPRFERYGIWLDEVTPSVREA